MPFDPDTYLASKPTPQTAAFDPDAYLSGGKAQENGGMWRNLAAGAEGAITGLPSALVNLFPGSGMLSETGQAIGQKLAHPGQRVTSVIDPSQMSPALNAGLGQISPAINPDTVTANSFPERLSRGIGGGLMSALIPGEEGYGIGSALTNAGLGAASGGGATTGAEIANQTGHPNLAPLASVAGSTAPLVTASLVRALTVGGNLTPNEEQAMNAGYKLPPATMENPSVLSKVLGGFSGKIKTQQAASAANQDVTTSFAHKELGLPDDTVLSNNVFDHVRDTAGSAYQAIRDFAPRIGTDDDFRTDVANASNLNGDLAKDFPELVSNDKVSQLATAMAGKKDFSTSAGLEAVKTLRAAATKNIQADDPQANDLGMVQRNLASAIDDLMARNMEAAGSPDLVRNYQAARQIIAKSYDIQAATNPATGEVNATKIAQIANRRPISGGLQTVADVANAFPKAVQSSAKFGGVEPLSVLDILGALGSTATGFAAGHPAEGLAAATAVLSRPAARALILSKPYQAAIANPGATNAASYLPSNLQPLVGALNQYQGQ